MQAGRQTDRQNIHIGSILYIPTHYMHAQAFVYANYIQLLICWICLSLAVAKVLERKKAWERTE